MHSVVPSPRGCSEWQHTGMAGATVAPVVSVAACCSPWLPHLEQIAAQTLPETLRFQRDAGPTAGTRAGCWVIFVLYFIKISFLSLFILKGTISGCPRGTQVGADRPVYPGVSRVGSPLAPQSTGCLWKARSTLVLFSFLSRPLLFKNWFHGERAEAAHTGQPAAICSDWLLSNPEQPWLPSTQ